MAEEKGRGSGLRSRVAILRHKAHLKIYVSFIFEGFGWVLGITAVESRFGVTGMSVGSSFVEPLPASAG